ncbi:MAG: hypothetical protein KAJ81_11445 [Candidatus Latescibacteria bacterium]|nr:hypothetical protein [Candidatus Latescibacterota bacterium]
MWRSVADRKGFFGVFQCPSVLNLCREDVLRREENAISGRATEHASPLEAIRNMLDRMANLVLRHAIEGRRKKTEGIRRTARELQRECADR